ncbi:MAG: thioredoxin family protein [Desulfonatronovibrio sp.]|nr:thioredoxin family protein [Desulfovibrionales bacterium]
MKKIIAAIIFISAVFTLMFLYTAQEQSRETALEPLPEIPAENTVTMLNLGADSCLPCKMMQPILKELRVEYEDQVSIPFIDVWKYKNQAQRFRVTTIPTQIFYDHLGEERFRHTGFMEKEAVIEVIEELLKKQQATTTDS